MIRSLIQIFVAITGSILFLMVGAVYFAGLSTPEWIWQW